MANTRQRLALLTQITAVMPALLAAADTAVILGLGGLEVMDGGMTIGALVAFQSLAISFITPFHRLVELGGRVQEIDGDLARLDDVMACQRDQPFRRRADDSTSRCRPDLTSSGSMAGSRSRTSRSVTAGSIRR